MKKKKKKNVVLLDLGTYQRHLRRQGHPEAT